MRIPTENPAFYLSESEHKAFAEKTRTGPIGASAGLRSTLSDSVPEKPCVDKSGKKVSRKKPDQQDVIRNDERRQQERRERSLPVVLDTRLKQRRREIRLHASVNFEI